MEWSSGVNQLRRESGEQEILGSQQIQQKEREGKQVAQVERETGIAIGISIQPRGDIKTLA